MMVADFFTKPLVGSLFVQLKEYILGWRPMSALIVQLKDTRIKEDVEILKKYIINKVILRIQYW